MSSQYYFLNASNETRGPFSLADAWSMIEQGILEANVQVNDGAGNWQPLSAYAELACRLSDFGIARRRAAREMLICVMLTVLFPVLGLYLGIVDVLKPAPRRWQGGILLAVAVISTVVALSIAGWLRSLVPVHVPLSHPTQPPKWEYKLVNPSDEHFAEEMNALGRDGWEVVSARRASNGTDHDLSYEIIVKRSR